MPQAQGIVERSQQVATRTGKTFLGLTIQGTDYSCWDQAFWPHLAQGQNVTFEWEQRLDKMTGQARYNIVGVLGVAATPRQGQAQVNPAAQAYAGPPPVVPPGPLPTPSKSYAYEKTPKEQTHIMRQNCQGVAGVVIAAAIRSGAIVVNDMVDLVGVICGFHIQYARRIEMEYVLGFGEGGSIPQPNWDESPGTPGERGEVG